MFLTLSYIDFDIINYKKTTKNQYPLILLYKFIDSYKNIVQKKMNCNKINLLLILNKLMNL